MKARVVGKKEDLLGCPLGKMQERERSILWKREGNQEMVWRRESEAEKELGCVSA